jgi:endoglucanase
MNRRQFLQAAAVVSASSLLARAQPNDLPTTRPANLLPRWRGFNLLGMFDAAHPHDFKEADFEIIADWGFDFVRLPCSYLCWSSHEDWTAVREEPLANIDRAMLELLRAG